MHVRVCFACSVPPTAQRYVVDSEKAENHHNREARTNECNQNIADYFFTSILWCIDLLTVAASTYTQFMQKLFKIQIHREVCFIQTIVFFQGSVMIM